MEKDLEEITKTLTQVARQTTGPDYTRDLGLVAIGRALVALCDRLDKMTGTLDEGCTKKALTIFDWSRNP
jgi:hypothetical protein